MTVLFCSRVGLRISRVVDGRVVLANPLHLANFSPSFSALNHSSILGVRRSHGAPTQQSQKSNVHISTLDDPLQPIQVDTSTSDRRDDPGQTKSDRLKQIEVLQKTLDEESLSASKLSSRIRERVDLHSRKIASTKPSTDEKSESDSSSHSTTRSRTTSTEQTKLKGSLWMRAKRKLIVVKGFFGSYLEGISLFAQELRLALRLARRVYWERHRYSRRERLQLQQCAADLAKV
jgi:hypothetical protein